MNNYTRLETDLYFASLNQETGKIDLTLPKAIRIKEGVRGVYKTHKEMVEQVCKRNTRNI